MEKKLSIMFFLMIDIPNTQIRMYGKARFNYLPLSTACPKELCLEIGSSWETLESFLMEDDLLDGIGGSKAWELRLCTSSSAGCIKGFVTEGSVSGVCLLVRDVERKELLNLDNEVVPRNPMFGDGTLLYRSIDCLKHQSQENNKHSVVKREIDKNKKM